MFSSQYSLSMLFVALSLLFLGLQPHHGLAARCLKNIPTVTQKQVGFSQPPRFAVVVQNSCTACPVIDVHVRCGTFPQSLVNPRVFRVVGPDDCVVNSGLPLPPLQSISFNYTAHSMFRLSPKSWSFQCE